MKNKRSFFISSQDARFSAPQPSRNIHSENNVTLSSFIVLFIVPYCLSRPHYRRYNADFPYPNSCLQSVRVVCSCFPTSVSGYDKQGISATQSETVKFGLSNTENFKYSNIFIMILIPFPLPLPFLAIAHNVGAAWRSGGGTLRFLQGTVAENYATAFQQGFHPDCRQTAR